MATQHGKALPNAAKRKPVRRQIKELDFNRITLLRGDRAKLKTALISALNNPPPVEGADLAQQRREQALELEAMARFLVIFRDRLGYGVAIGHFEIAQLIVNLVAAAPRFSRTDIQEALQTLRQYHSEPRRRGSKAAWDTLCLSRRRSEFIEQQIAEIWESLADLRTSSRRTKRKRMEKGPVEPDPYEVLWIESNERSIAMNVEGILRLIRSGDKLCLNAVTGKEHTSKAIAD